MDECQDQTHNCALNARCNNTIGSFNCTCLQGYSGDGVDCYGIVSYRMLSWLLTCINAQTANSITSACNRIYGIIGDHLMKRSLG